MKLITLEDDYPVFNPEARMIKDFQNIIIRDKGTKGDHDGRKKRLATKELAFVHFMVYHNSEFVTSYSEKDREKALIKHLDLPDGWKPDGLVQMAMSTYKELMSTPSTDSLLEIRESLFSANELIKIYRRRLESKLQELNMEFTGDDEDENEKKMQSLLDGTSKLYDKIMNIGEKMPNTLDIVNKLEERVKKEMQAEQKGRKQESVNSFEL